MALSITATKLRILERSRYYSPDETRDQYCRVCDDQVTAGELLHVRDAVWFHTCCLIGRRDTHQLHALVTNGVR